LSTKINNLGVLAAPTLHRRAFIKGIAALAGSLYQNITNLKSIHPGTANAKGPIIDPSWVQASPSK
jgi:hypothetical protein